MTTIMIMAGGTGGHVFPGLAVANQLQQQQIRVVWMGSQGGLEQQWVSQANIAIHLLPVAGLRGKSRWQKLKAPWMLLRCLFQAAKILRSTRPSLVVSMGGFVAGPGGLMARLMGIPLLIHEQNAKAGLTNRALRRLAAKTLQGFAGALPNGVTTGNPVRHDFWQQGLPSQRYSSRDEQALRLLVVGGSRGARAFNRQLPQLLSQLDTPLTIRHQTGSADLNSTTKNYQHAKLTAEVVPFIDDMAAAYSWADLVICRAGALTVSELMAVGVAAVLVPFPHAVDDHQTANALQLTEHQGGVLLPESRLEQLPNLIKQQDLLNRKRLQMMANQAYQQSTKNAVEQIVHHCYEVLK